MERYRQEDLRRPSKPQELRQSKKGKSGLDKLLMSGPIPIDYAELEF